MKNVKKLTVVIEYPNGKTSEKKFDTEKGARQYAKLKGDGTALVSPNGGYEVPVSVYRK